MLGIEARCRGRSQADPRPDLWRVVIIVGGKGAFSLGIEVAPGVAGLSIEVDAETQAKKSPREGAPGAIFARMSDADATPRT
jgi:hypothetical protein